MPSSGVEGADPGSSPEEDKHLTGTTASGRHRVDAPSHIYKDRDVCTPCVYRVLRLERVEKRGASVNTAHMASSQKLRASPVPPILPGGGSRPQTTS